MGIKTQRMARAQYEMALIGFNTAIEQCIRDLQRAKDFDEKRQIIDTMNNLAVALSDLQQVQQCVITVECRRRII